MPSLSSVREKYPQYADLPDDVLAEKLHDKFYSDIPREQYFSKLGIADPNPPTTEPETKPGSAL